MAEIPLPTSVVSIQLTPQSPTVTAAATQQFSATATLNNGNTQDVTASAVWNSSATSVIEISNVSQTQGFAVGITPGAATISAALGSVMANTSITVVSAPPAPIITTVSPTSGSAGTQVTVTGSRFGSAQGQGNLLLGSTMATIVSWSDTQIVATVAAASTSGTAQVTQGGLQSNSVNFSVASATITSVTPTSGVPGTQVTIAGSGFGATQGTGQVWLGTMNGIVSSWGGTQVIATIAAGSTSGNAQILQGGALSNPVAFTVVMPIITSITPSTGPTGTSVTFAGSGFGSSQGSGTVWIGAAYASITAWSNTQVVATVAANAITGIAKIQQNGTWSNALTFTVPASGGSGASVTLVPNVFSMVVGGISTIQALNSNNRPVTGLTWTSSDATIVTLSTDDPPVLTAMTPGHATIFGGTASADVTVYAGSTLPAGTVQWSNPGDGSGVSYIVPAVPSASGVDVFGLEQSGNIQAIKTDGSVTWTTNLSNSANLYNPPIINADFQGGANVFTGNSIYELDGATGQVHAAYVGTSTADQNLGLGYPLIHTDGTIFTVDSSCTPQNCPGNYDNTTGAWVVGIDPSNGQAKFKVPIASSTINITVSGPVPVPDPNRVLCTPQTRVTPSLPSNSIIAGDGYAYFIYEEFNYNGKVEEPIQPFPQAAYSFYYQLGGDLDNPSAALADIAALQPILGDRAYIFDLVKGAEQSNNIQGAILQYGKLYTLFEPLCNATYSTIYKLHLLQVGSDGSSSDSVIHQWTQTTSSVGKNYGPDGLYPYFYNNYTVQQSGTDPVLQTEMITNADTGTLLSWRVYQQPYCAVLTPSGNSSFCTANVGAMGEFHLTTTTGSSVASDAVWSVPGTDPITTPFPVFPVLQLQDGSFVGSTYNATMLNFGPSGNIKWMVPNYGSQIATADGGVIATTPQVCGSNGCTPGIPYTFDGNGNVTGQIGPFPTYSWKGAYQVGSVVSIIPPFDLAGIATTFAAVNGGNLTGNGFYLANHTFGLIFCNSGLGGDGVCPNYITNMAFTYQPGVNNDTYSSACDFSQRLLCDSNSAHPDWVNTIKIQAINAYKKAFANLPAIISKGYSPINQNGNSNNPPFQHAIYIDGSWAGGAPCPNGGLTTTPQWSRVYYLSEMCGAQFASAMGSYGNSPIFDPPFSDPTNFLKLVVAFGKGIGTTAAHETGWELTFAGSFTNGDQNHYPLTEMKCGEAFSCENGVNSVYEYYEQANWNFVDWTPPITWEPTDRCNIERYLLNTNLTSNNCNGN